MKNNRVWYTENGFNELRNFDDCATASEFASEMAKEGKLLEVIENGIDTTENYIKVIKIN